ncbi:MAG: hypothetical protein KGJ60_06485 [Verrucomicrobiota bacterium]|nr:hypothetical protein [Verrucomicrobiota bacterium]
MFRTKTQKEHRRFYLLPGQGGRPLRRKHKLYFRSAVIVGLLVAGILTALLYWLNTHGD